MVMLEAMVTKIEVGCFLEKAILRETYMPGPDSPVNGDRPARVDPLFQAVTHTGNARAL